MSPEQLDSLQHLSRLFEEGIANIGEIKELSELLSVLNHHRELQDLNQNDNFTSFEIS